MVLAHTSPYHASTLPDTITVITTPGFVPVKQYEWNHEEFHRKDMRYATPLTLGVLVHSIYWYRTDGGDGSSDLPRLRRTEPSTLLPVVCSYH